MVIEIMNLIPSISCVLHIVHQAVWTPNVLFSVFETFPACVCQTNL